MICTACTNPTGGVYVAGCRACTVRRLARSAAFHQSNAAGRRTAEYKRLLTQSFGEGWEAGHAEVKAQYDREHSGVAS